MKKLLPVALAALLLLFAVITEAQQYVPPNRVAEENLDAVYAQCARAGGCDTETRLQVIAAEKREMDGAFERIRAACAEGRYRGCTDPQLEDVQDWNTASSRIQRLMSAMEAETLAAGAPAAGAPPAAAKKRQWWRRLW